MYEIRFSNDFTAFSGANLNWNRVKCKNSDHTCLFHCINICRVPRKMFKHSSCGFSLGKKIHSISLMVNTQILILPGGISSPLSAMSQHTCGKLSTYLSIFATDSEYFT